MNTQSATEQKKCIIWGTSLTLKSSTYPDSRTDHTPVFRKLSDESRAYEVYNPRAGGKYISENLLFCKGELALGDNRKLTDKEKIRLSGWIAKENLRGNTPPTLESVVKDKNSLEMLSPIPNPGERAYLLLEGLVRDTDVIGKTFCFSSLMECFIEGLPIDLRYIFYYALSYCSDKEEMRYLFNYLQELKFITFNGHTFYITVKGFEKNTLNIKSKTAFIAMWFKDSSSMCELKKNIQLAVKNAGYEALRIDDIEHLDKVDDQILVRVKEARFIICDLTSEKEKPRGSVYFEAGYAEGQGKPVIWTCNKELENEIAFNVRQYPFLFWEQDKMDEFIKKLQYRIENNIGSGPLKERV